MVHNDRDRPLPGSISKTWEEEWVSPDGPNAEREYRHALRRRLLEFTRRTRHRVVALTGQQEIARSDDPLEVLQALLDNWPRLEPFWVKHGAFYPLIDKVRKITNDVTCGTGAFTRSEQAYVNAGRSTGILETTIRRAGAEEVKRGKRNLPCPVRYARGRHADRNTTGLKNGTSREHGNLPPQRKHRQPLWGLKADGPCSTI